MNEKRFPKHCHLCGRRLWGNGWLYVPEGDVEARGIVVCRNCNQHAPRCDACGVPVGANQVYLPDGRHICSHCHQTAVYDQAGGREAFAHVARVITDQLGLGLNVGTDFTLVDHQHLKRLAAQASSTPEGDPDQVLGLFVHRGHRRSMYLLSGLPRILLVQTVAHEWAHAWEGENCPLLRDPLVREGFAEWVAYKTLQAMGAVKKMALMERRNGLYGDGLRAMLELEHREGAAGVLNFCRRSE